MPLDAFEISGSSLLAGLVFGVIGMYVFRRGKLRQEFDVLFIGIALMVYPYFTKGPIADWGVGIALCALAYYRPYLD